MKTLMASEVAFVAGASDWSDGEGGGSSGGTSGGSFVSPNPSIDVGGGGGGGWGADWVVRYDSGGSWIDTGHSCVPLNANPSDSGFFSNAYREASDWFYRTVDRCVFTELQLGTGGVNITFDCGPK
jgi:hypothetical protein